MEKQIRQQTRVLRQQLADHGLTAEFVAPRLWMHPLTIDGAFSGTGNQTSP